MPPKKSIHPVGAKPIENLRTQRASVISLKAALYERGDLGKRKKRKMEDALDRTGLKRVRQEDSNAAATGKSGSLRNLLKEKGAMHNVSHSHGSRYEHQNAFVKETVTEEPHDHNESERRRIMQEKAKRYEDIVTQRIDLDEEKDTHHAPNYSVNFDEKIYTRNLEWDRMEQEMEQRGHAAKQWWVLSGMNPREPKENLTFPTTTSTDTATRIKQTYIQQKMQQIEKVMKAQRDALEERQRRVELSASDQGHQEEQPIEDNDYARRRLAFD